MVSRRKMIFKFITDSIRISLNLWTGGNLCKSGGLEVSQFILFFLLVEHSEENSNLDVIGRHLGTKKESISWNSSLHMGEVLWHGIFEASLESSSFLCIWLEESSLDVLSDEIITVEDLGAMSIVVSQSIVRLLKTSFAKGEVKIFKDSISLAEFGSII